MSETHLLDGSYVAGYRVFCETVVKGLQDAVAQVFKDDLSVAPVDENSEQGANSRKTEVLSGSATLPSSRRTLSTSSCNILPLKTVLLLAAKRELEEETGYIGGELVPLLKIYPSVGYTDEVIHVYEARVA